MEPATMRMGNLMGVILLQRFCCRLCRALGLNSYARTCRHANPYARTPW